MTAARLACDDDALARALDALRGIGWREVRIAVLFGLVVRAADVLTFLAPILHIAQSKPLHLMLTGDMLCYQAKALVLMAAVVIADAAADRGVGMRAYVIAAVVGCLVGQLLTLPVDFAWKNLVIGGQFPASRPWLHGAAALIYWPVFQLTHWLLIGSATVFLYADRRAARKTAQLLDAAERDRLKRSKLALESRLQAMQARVEPQFLFNTLAQVERLYELDPLLASRVLDELIAYLRAAMPRMRDTSSTVAQEIELVRAYLAIVRIRLDDRLDFHIDVPSAARDVRMPPMVLLPLVDHAVVHGLGPANSEGRLDVTASLQDGRLRLTLMDTGAGFVPESPGSAIADITMRLEALYGGKARLALVVNASQGTTAVLDLPLDVPAKS